MMMCVMNLIAFTSLIAVIYYQHRQLSTDFKIVYYVTFVTKLLASLSVGYVYIYHYRTGDTLFFFDKAVALSQEYSISQVMLSDGLPIGFDNILKHSRDVFFLKITYLLVYFFGNSYWMIAIVMAAISFFFSWTFIYHLSYRFPKIKKSAIVAFLLIPSTLFWSSGLIKETVTCSLIMIQCTAVLILLRRKRTYLMLVIFLLASVMLFKLKYYVAIVWFPILVLYYLFKRYDIPKASSIVKLIFVGGGILMFWLLTSTIHVNLNIDYMLKAIAENHDELLKHTAAHNLISFNDLEPSLGMLIWNSPKAIFYGLFGPLFRFSNLLQGLSSLENICFFCLSGLAIFNLKKEDFMHTELWFLLLVILSLSLFITLSTPNFGTLVRYSTAYKPFFWLLVLSKLPLTTWISVLLRKDL